MNIANQSVPLPEDVLKLKYYGDFAGAQKLIGFLLNQTLPQALRQRLEIERDVLTVMAGNEYPYSFAQASACMEQKLRDYAPAELTGLKETGGADWIFINGEVRFQRRFFENLIKTRPEYAKRLITPENSDEAAQKKQLLNDNVRVMKEQGGRTVEIRLRSSIAVKKEFERIGEQVRVHLPLPRNCRQVSDFTLIKTIPEAAIIASPDAIQRTACFETTLRGDQTFSVEYTYKNHVDYIELDPAQARSAPSPVACLEEQLPHIRFTPYLRLLLEEILSSGEAGNAAATNPVVKARRIYDFITTQVMYSFMREYFTIDNVSEYGAVNLKGDCGVQAILFITLCRMAGIPARWQSGLYVTGLYTGPHDWAEFYVEPWGWVFADLSFGGSSWRSGEQERWNYYFGNLDVFRMPANGGILEDFAPPKTHLRIDPVDNQRGEFEYADQGLPFAALETRQELLSFRDV